MNGKHRGQRGLGSLYEVRVNGVLVYKASKSFTYEDPDTGKKVRKRITGTGRTRQEALARLDERMAYRAGGQVPSTQEINQGKHPFNEWFYEWLESIPEQKVSDIVKHGYRRKGEMYLVPYLGNTAVEDLETEDLKKLFDFTLPSLTKPDGSPVLSTASLLNVYRVLQMCLTEATRRKKIGILLSPLAGVSAPQRNKNKESLGEKIGLTQGLLKKLKETNDPDYCRWLFQYLGLRRSERLGLSWTQVKNLNKPASAKIVIDQQLARYQDGSGWYLKHPKTQASTREIALVEPFYSAIKDYKKLQDSYKQNPEWSPPDGFEDLVFLRPKGNLITPNRDNEDWHELLDGYLTKGEKHWRGHLNRHITATLLAQNNVPPALAQKILGHASSSMTYYYTSITTSSMIQPLSGYGEVLMKRLNPEND